MGKALVRAVPLSGERGAGLVALVDDADYELVSGYRWYAHGDVWVYPMRVWKDGGKTRTQYMHILIMGRPWIDHDDGDGLNNQRSNLRPATARQNMANRRKHAKCSSQYKGATWNKQVSKWQAGITMDRKYHYLGVFADEIDAAKAYDAAARAAWGEFARCNFPEGAL